MTRPSRAVLPLAAAASLAACVPCFGQTDPVLDASVLETVDVEVVNVEIYVTDEKGRTVDGLGRDDFRLFVDQKPTEIVNFYRSSGASPAAAETSEAIPRTGVVAPAERLTLAILVDHQQLTPGGRSAYLRQIGEFLDGRLTADDRVLIVSHDLGLRLEERFTGDSAAVLGVLDELLERTAGGVEYGRQYQTALDRIENVLQSGPTRAGTGDPCERVDQMHGVARDFGEWVGHQVEFSLFGLERLVTALSPMEGRKAVLYLSNGLHQQPASALHLQISELCPAQPVQMGSNEMSARINQRTRRVTRLANAEGVVVHTLDASRLENQLAPGIARNARFEVDDYVFDFRPSTEVQARERDSRQATLFTLAQETGGLAVLNANDIGLDLGKIEDSLRRYYSLGFSPGADFEAGSVHALNVELVPPRPGHTLYYRRTHVTQAPADRTAARLVSALLLGHRDNPLGVEIELGRPQVGDSGLPTVPLHVAVPFASLGWLEHGDYRTGEIELFIAVQSADGDDIDMRRKSIPFQLKESLWATARESTHTLEIALPVPSTDVRLAFAVADRIGSRTSYLSPEPDRAAPSPTTPGY